MVDLSKKNTRHTFEENVALLKKYIEENNRYPNKRDECQISKHSGYFLSDLRSKYTNPKLYISGEQIAYVDSQIPNFVWDYKRDTFTNNVDSLKQFLEQQKYWPRRKHSSATIEEKKLAKFVAHVRNSYQNIDIQDANVAYKLDQDRLDYLYDHIPEFTFQVDKESQYEDMASRLNSYIKEHNRLPRKVGSDRTIEEKKLGTFLNNLKQSIKLKRSTIPEILLALDKQCPVFNYKEYFNIQ